MIQSTIVPGIEQHEFPISGTRYFVHIARSKIVFDRRAHEAKMNEFRAWAEESGAVIDEIDRTWTIVDWGSPGGNRPHTMDTWVVTFPEFSHAVMFMFRWANDG